MDDIIKILLSSATTIGLIIFLVLFFPEKIEKWLSLLWKGLSKLGPLFKWAHKNYVKHDFQSHINQYVKSLVKIVPSLETKKAKIEWVDTDVSKKSFLEENQVVIRLKKDDPKNLNFVHSVYHFVSTGLLYRAKRYISPSQRESVDLFVTSKVLEKEKHQVLDYFLETYLHPELQNEKKFEYYEKFHEIDKRGYFFPVLVQELDFLGMKVFGEKKTPYINIEVDSLIDFLKTVSGKVVGDDEKDLRFTQNYCRFAVMIIGKKDKSGSSGPYVHFIKDLHSKNVESIYAIGLFEKKDFIEDICNEVKDFYEICHQGESNAVLYYKNGTQAQVKQYYIILRKGKMTYFQSGFSLGSTVAK